MDANYAAILHGVKTRGDGGVLYVNFEKNTRGYLFPHEFADPNVKRDLAELLQRETSKEFFFVLEERDRKMHVLAYSKETVLEHTLKFMEAQEKSEPLSDEDVASSSQDKQY